MSTAILQCPIQFVSSQNLIFLMHNRSNFPICHMLVSCYSYLYIQPEESFSFAGKKKEIKRERERENAYMLNIFACQNKKQEQILQDKDWCGNIEQAVWFLNKVVLYTNSPTGLRVRADSSWSRQCHGPCRETPRLCDAWRGSQTARSRQRLEGRLSMRTGVSSSGFSDSSRHWLLLAWREDIPRGSGKKGRKKRRCGVE